MPVNTGTGIPAGGGLRGGIAADGDDVVAAEIQMTGQIVIETDVAERAVTEVEAVDPHVAILHHAIEPDGYGLARVRLGQGEMLAIPAEATGQERTSTDGFVRIGEGAFDAPVVREVELAPVGVGEGGLLRAGGV